MRNAVLALLAINLCGCVAMVKEVYGPDGQQAHAITCSAFGADWSDCFEEAGEICGTKGYKVWNQASSTSTMVSGTEGNMMTTTAEGRALLISCK